MDIIRDLKILLKKYKKNVVITNKIRHHVKNQMPKPHKGIISAYRSIIPAIFKQSKDKNYFIEVKIPDTTI